MNAHVSFNTLIFVRRLEAAGMDGKQAEALAEALLDVVFETTATKSDMRELDISLKREFEVKLKELELRLTVRMGAMFAGTVAILGALITFK